MTDKGDKLDKFNSIATIFKSKYKMTIEGMIRFVKDKVDSPEQTLQRIERVILSNQKGKQMITQEQLKQYLHLIAAAQAKIDIQNKIMQEFQPYVKIKFKSSKKKQQEQPTQKKETSYPSLIDQEASKKAAKIQINQQVQKNEYNDLAKQRKKQHKLQNYSEKNNRKQETLNKITTQNTKTPVKQQNIKKSIGSPHKQKVEEKPELSVIIENVADENRVSNVIKAFTSKSQQFFLQFPQAQMLKIPFSLNKKVQITGYDKFGQNYFNPIIKFRIAYDDKIVYRRYTEFQNLMIFLNIKYEGLILPELPPKEGIKYNLSYLTGIDEAFLNQRQLKLQEMLNLLINSNSNLISEDEVLLKFLTQQNFEVESAEKGGTLSYLQSISKVVFNAKQLKNYGMAYYNYWKQFKKTDIKTKITTRYKEVEPILAYCITLDNYRLELNKNFDRRRQIFKELQTDQNDRMPSITEFDKSSAITANEVKNLQKQINKYLQLKSQESWLFYLIGQKEIEKDPTLQQLKKQHEQIKIRIQKMQYNLMQSIDTLQRIKRVYLEQIKGPIMQWRRLIHP